jgi:hypothetical protein
MEVEILPKQFNSWDQFDQSNSYETIKQKKELLKTLKELDETISRELSQQHIIRVL